ncbi:potassium channel family protein [uncultured Jannaschia sp.]|uniref:potassium channel family protein n=1 Tax=uncultured Jannaschia sp. TaxID=293347 RepID=UPI00260A6144|nr:potassium channel family protein [uncultured Jannaschia sp.]
MSRSQTRPGPSGFIRSLYLDHTRAARRFRYALLLFDVLTVVFVIVTSFFPRSPTVEVLDAIFGVLILADFLIRLRLETERGYFLMRFTTWADIAAIVSFLAPVAGEGLGFLRILRTLRLLRSYHLLAQLRKDVRYFRAHEDIILAAVNLGVFLFVMTGLIYTTQWAVNPEIGNYADALYFTVTTLTTTGFGDITLTGPWGRMLSVAVMIFGVTLFLRLLQVLFRPSKVRQECDRCGLLLHDPDAVHCKHCGATMHIVTEGLA